MIKYRFYETGSMGHGRSKIFHCFCLSIALKKQNRIRGGSTRFFPQQKWHLFNFVCQWIQISLYQSNNHNFQNLLVTWFKFTLLPSEFLLWPRWETMQPEDRWKNHSYEDIDYTLHYTINVLPQKIHFFMKLLFIRFYDLSNFHQSWYRITFITSSSIILYSSSFWSNKWNEKYYLFKKIKIISRRSCVSWRSVSNLVSLINKTRCFSDYN